MELSIIMLSIILIMQENSDVSFEDVFPSNLQSLIQPKYSFIPKINIYTYYNI